MKHHLGRLAVAAILTLVATGLLLAPAAGAFGISELDTKFTEADGSVASQAGSHPFEQAFSIGFEQVLNPDFKFEVPDGDPKDIVAELPVGFVGDTGAVRKCSAVAFVEARCPGSSQVGVSDAIIGSPGVTHTVALYSLAKAPGDVMRLGFIVLQVPITVDLRLDPNFPYNVIATSSGIDNAIPVYRTELHIWGVPGDPVHNSERFGCKSGCTGDPGAPPFLTLPRACHGPLPTVAFADSWQEQGMSLPDGLPNLSDPAWVREEILTHESAEPPAPQGFSGCSSLGFAPTIAAHPTATSAESPSGLEFSLDVHDSGLTEAGGVAESDIEKAVVTLSRGITTNPSVATGLEACTFAEYQSAGPGDPGCPEASKVGTVEVESQLLKKDEEEGPGLKVLHGSIYVAKQGDNPFHNLLTIYMVIEDPGLGIFVKLPGKVEPDPKTGQLTTTFGEPGFELPQLPFSHFHFHFREGQRGPLITPSTCGDYTTNADLYPYASGVAAVHETATFDISSGAGGAPCASSESALPSQPRFSAGTTSSQAGAYSPFVLNLSRPDGSQQLSRIQTTLPVGLLGKLAGIAYCPESGISQAASRTGEGDGAKELAQASCPSSSQVGIVTATAGAGTEPLTVTGKAYLAGPYKGAPLSLEIITPAIAGPFDLGVVAVRTALKVDPLTAQITAESDQIPTILHGLPLDLRSISIDIDRQSFTLNPTSCEPKSIAGSAISTLGTVAPLSQYFQASNCAALALKPKLALTLKGSTKRAGNPGLRAVLTYPKGPGYANIGRAQVNLPHGEFIDQANLNKVCTKPVLIEGNCPSSTVYGKATAWSPLLDQPLTGNVYLVGGFGYKLPALVAELDGQIRVLLVGKIDTGPNGGIRNTFETVPDAPVEKFELQLKGGKRYSLLENSESLCQEPQKAIVRFTAQNGLVLQSKPNIANGCKGRGGSKKKRHPKNK